MAAAAAAAVLDADAVVFAEDVAPSGGEADLLLLTVSAGRQRKVFEAVPLMRRAGGVLLAVPPGAYPPSRLRAGQHVVAGALVGPSTSLSVSGSAGSSLTVLLVDFSEAVWDSLQSAGEVDEAETRGFADDGELPLGSELLAAAEARVAGVEAPSPRLVE